MAILSAYLKTWRLKLSHAKTVTAAFHLHNREAVRVSTSKRKIRVSTTILAARMKVGKIFWIIKESKAVNICPSSQALSIHTFGTIAPVSMQAFKITSIKTGVRDHWDIRGLQSCWWRFVDVDYFCTHQRPHTTHRSPILVGIALTIERRTVIFDRFIVLLLFGQLLMFKFCIGQPMSYFIFFRSSGKQKN